MEMNHYAMFTPDSLIHCKVRKDCPEDGEAIIEINEFHYELEAEKIKLTTDYDIGKAIFHEAGGTVYVIPPGREEYLRLPDDCKEVEVVELVENYYGNKRSFQDRIIKLLYQGVKVFLITPEILYSSWDEAVLDPGTEGWNFIRAMTNKVQFVLDDDPICENCDHLPWHVEKVKAI
jgi:hypothetical protein